MSSRTKIIIAALSFLNCVIWVLAVMPLLNIGYAQAVVIPVRPALTHPEPREALIISQSASEMNYDFSWVSLLIEGIDRNDSGNLLPGRLRNEAEECVALARVYLGKISQLSARVEYDKRVLDGFCSLMGLVLTRQQLEHVIHKIDLFTLDNFEFPYWEELLKIVGARAS